MKRIFTLLFSLALISTQAQNKFDVLFSEDFNGGTLPAGWELHNLDGLTPNVNVGGITQAWTVLNRGGGNFGMYSTSWYTPAGVSNDWVTTTAIDLSEIEASDYELISLNFNAVTLDADFPDGYEVYINTVGQALENFTPETRVLNVPAENTTETSRSIDLSDYLGQSIYVAFRNNSNDKFVLIVDDIRVLGVSGFSASIDETTYRVYNEVGSLNIGVSGTNQSAANAENITVEYSVDGNTTTETYTVGNIGLLGAINYNIPLMITEPGAKTVSITMTQVNGNDLTNPETTTFDASFIAEENKALRKPLIETFTSATCGPCLPGNTLLHNLLNAIPEEDKPVVIKFQQDFPSVGDGYATAESISRRGIYGINGIPNTNINGHDFDNNTNSLTAANISNATARSAFFDVQADYFVNPNSQTVYVKGSYTPLTEVVANTRLMIAIQENETDNNVATNGETEFLDVFKKFIEGSEGIPIEAGIAVGEAVEFEYAYEFQGNYRDPADASSQINHDTEHSVEEFEDLSVKLWIESTLDYNVLNAANGVQNSAVSVESIANVNDIAVYPNPVMTDLNITIDLVDSDLTKFRVIDANGKNIMNLANQNLVRGKHNVTFNVSDLPSGVYYLRTGTTLGATFTPFVKL